MKPAHFDQHGKRIDTVKPIEVFQLNVRQGGRRGPLMNFLEWSP